MNSLFDRRKFIKFFGGGIALASSGLAFTHSMNEKASEILLALIKKYFNYIFKFRISYHKISIP